MPAPEPGATPPVELLGDLDAVREAVLARRLALEEAARRHRDAGILPDDQDFASEILALRPPEPLLRPLLLLGGMGPLAGLDGLLAAAERSGDLREIVLYQACLIPNRSEAQGEEGAFVSLTRALVEALRLGLSAVQGEGPIDVILLCNAAHGALPAVIAGLEELAPAMAVRARVWSLIDAVKEWMLDEGLRAPLVLSTRATRSARLYPRVLALEGIAAQEPDAEVEELLIRAIYAGVKAADRELALALGARAFALLSARHPTADALVLGCTELPVLLGWMREAGLSVPTLPMVDPVQAVLELNAELLGGSGEVTIHERFFLVAARSSARVALVTPSRTWTYGALAAEVRRLAAGLLARLGPGSAPVAVLVDGRGEQIPLLLGILASGRPYVPVDADVSEGRGRAILAASGAAWVLVVPEHRELAERIAPPGSVVIEASALEDRGDPLPARGADALAYVLFTSGSTGEPKGVAQDHRYVLRLVENYGRTGRITSDDRLALLSSLAFSASVRDLYCALLTGGSLHTWDVAGAGLEGLPAWLEARGITVFFAVASLFRRLGRLIAPGALPALRMAQIGSEAVYGSDVALFQERFPPGCELMVNLGSTELSPIRQRVFRRGDPVPEGVVPLDLSVPGNEVSLLDEAGQPVGAGEPGEIVVRGRALPVGFWGSPERTLERLRPDALGARRLRTGDVGVWTSEGALRHLGRLDRQLKVRGYRVDGGEVEAALRALPGVREAAVDVDAQGALIAWLAPVDPASPPTDRALRRALLARLPEPMVPARFVTLDALPLGDTGKVDRRALPAPPGPGWREPTTPTERRMAALWEQILGRPVGADDPLLTLGGSSLEAARIAAGVSEVFGIHLPVRAVFETPTVAGLAARLDMGAPGGGERGDGGTGLELPPLRSLERGARTPLSSAQRAFWIQERLWGPRPEDLLVRAWRIRGPLAADALEAALADLVERHEALRAVFDEVDGEPGMRALAHWRPLIEVEDLSRQPRVDRCLDEILSAELQLPMPIGAGPLFEVKRIQLEMDDSILLLRLHHVVGDDASARILARDLGELYAARLEGRAPDLPALALQPGDLALWEREALPVLRVRHGAFWREALAEAPVALELPWDRPRGGRYEPAHVPLGLDARRVAALRALAAEEGATLFSALLCAFGALLGRLSERSEVLLGGVLSRRPPEARDLIGCFVQAIPLRLRLDPEAGFRALLRVAAREVPRALEAGALPLDTILDEAGAPRAAGLESLFSVILSLVEGEDALPSLPGLRTSPHPLERGTAGARFDLALALEEQGGVLSGRMDYDASRFESATVESLRDQLLTLLDAALARPAAPLGRLEIRSEAERAALAAWAEAPMAAPRVAPPERFLEIAAQRPEAVAIVACDAEGVAAATWTYAELRAGACRLAHALSREGVRPGDRVVLALERSAGSVIATLATWLCGAAIVPVDPSWPRERLALVIADVRPSAVVSRAAEAARLPEVVPWVDLEAPAIEEESPEPPGLAIPLDAPACLFYTSGSTGRPKGAVIPHRAVSRLVLETNFARMGEDVPVLNISNPAFDAVTFEVWAALLHGARLVVAPSGVLSTAAIEHMLREQGVRLGFLTSGLFNALVDERPQALAGYQRLLVGGEALSVSHVRKLLELAPTLELVNGYGPTECTTFSVWHLVLPRDLARSSIPIGRPLAGARLVVLDALGEPAPIGVPGELWIGGLGLADGYWERPELSAERFVEREGERWYRSGDRVRWGADGSLRFLGRTDDQIKLRGFRVELGEVEAALRALPGVRQAAVGLRELPSGRALLAWAVLEEGCSPEELLSSLSARLPAYTLPAALIAVPALPLNPNGKVDLRALPDPAASVEDDEAPRSPEEALICQLFQELLGRPAGRRAGFFALGGDSLLALRLISRLSERLGRTLPLRALWEAPTAEGLAERLSRDEEAGAVVEVRPEPGSEVEAPLSAAQARLWFLQSLEPDSATYNVSFALELRGSLDPDALEGALRDLCARHGVLRAGVGERGGEPHLFFRAAESLRLGREAFAGGDEALARRVTEDAERPFDLGRDLLLRATLLALGPARHALLIGMHHLVCDGWSMDIFARELRELYAARRAGRAHGLAPLPVSFADYAIAERRWLDSPASSEQARWWQERLEGAPPFVALPLDRPRTAERGSAGAQLERPLSAEAARAVANLARDAAVTPFMVGLAGLAVLLRRYGAEEDMVIGVPVAGRRARRVEGLVGFFVNTLALRLRAGDALRPSELLGEVRGALLDAWQRQELPFDRVVEVVQPRRSLAHSPLFNVMFDLEDGPPPWALEGLELSPLTRQHRLSRFDLTLALVRGPEGLSARWEYSAELFDPETVARLAEGYERVLLGLCERPEGSVRMLPLLSAEERERLLPEAEPGPGGPALLHALVLEATGRSPWAPAVEHGGKVWTYATLQARAEALAAALQARGVGRGERALILMERGPELYATLLGVMMAGAAWVPVDPTQPAERIARVAQDAGPKIALTSAALAPLLPWALPRLALDQGWPEPAPWTPPELDADDLCYVIYTSGSTGAPRGVAVPHRSAAAFTRSAALVYGLGSEDRVLQFASIAFDAAVEEIFPCLWAGGCLLPRTDELLQSPRYFLERCGALGVTALDLPTSYWHELTLDLERDPRPLPPALRLVIIGGEAAQPARLAGWRRRVGPRPRLLNTYGPTEATVVATACDLSAWNTADPAPAVVPVGRPLPGVRALVLGPDLEPAPVGAPGELYLGGAGLSQGYLGDPEASAAVFLPDPRRPGERLYRTGDRARWRSDGQLEFLGRVDQQLKIRGFRVEPGEIEAALRAHPAVAEALVGMWEHAGRSRLVAHVLGVSAGALDLPALKVWLRARLPEYMVPEALVALESLPTNRQGKVDRRALPPPVLELSAGTPTPPDSADERALLEIWIGELGIPHVGLDDNFFELGGTSLTLIRVFARVRDTLCPELSLVELFRLPTVRALAERIRQGRVPRPSGSAPLPLRGAAGPRETDIAVIALAGRFPGAEDPEALWDLLASGREGISRFSEAAPRQRGLVPAGGVLDDVTSFDARFFGFTPSDAALLDPQHRLFLECAWEALERAGVDPARFGGRVGVYAGAGNPVYLWENLLPNPEIRARHSRWALTLATDKDMLAVRVAYKLGLRGPAVGVQTACSTSLSAVHLASQALIAGECELALAGGVSLGMLTRSGYRYEEGMILSPDGRCRPFDAAASGTVPGSGAAVVLLRRAADAHAAGDPILAILRGSALGNDGNRKLGFTAPSPEGQSEVLRDALARAGLEPADIGFIEAHGTGTALGDPVEISALGEVYGALPPGSVTLGALKASLGHLDAAAGAAGLIKVVLSLQAGQLPPHPSFERMSEALGPGARPFTINRELIPWTGPRRAGVSAFGTGGTNAHVVLEQAPPPGVDPDPDPGPQLLALSARSPEGLGRLALALARRLEEPSAPGLADAAWTLATGRRAFPFRRAVVAQDTTAACASLRTWSAPGQVDHRPRIFLLFPGQGAQRPGMGQGLYETEPLYREAIDELSAAFAPALGLDLRTLLFPTPDRESEAAVRLQETRLTQPALFVTGLALWRLWSALGLEPAGMLGHSAGELVAATISGVLDLPDAVRAVVERAEAMQRCPPGAMLSVQLGLEALAEELDSQVEPAVIEPGRLVLAGPAERIEALERVLAERGVESVRLRTSHAFHSAAMTPAASRLERALRLLPLRPPRIPFVSNLSGDWIRPDQATDPAYWAAQLRAPVRLGEGLARLAEPGALLLELGPGGSLGSAARRVCPGIPTLRTLGSAQQGDRVALLAAAGQLWASGAELELGRLHAGHPRRRVRLPTTPFERTRCWVDAPPESAAPPRDAGGAGARERFQTLCWRERPAVPRLGPGRVLWLGDGAGLEGALTAELRAQGWGVDVVELSAHLDALKAGNAEAERQVVVFARGLSGPTALDGSARLELLAALGAALDRARATDLELVVLTRGVARLGREQGEIDDALLWGAARALPVELPGLRARCVDLDLAEPPATLARALARELRLSGEGELAWRAGRRWERALEPVVLEPAELAPVDGLVLITGGLGWIGLSLAAGLAREGSRIALLGRGLPTRPEQREALAALERAGATVRVVRVDLGDGPALSAALTRLEAELGPVRALIHAAGVADGGPLQSFGPGLLRRALRAKVEGLRALLAHLEGRPLAFLALCSSANALEPAPGQLAYAAANAWLDALALDLRAQGLPALSLGWDVWSGGGMAVTTRALLRLPPLTGPAIDPEQGREAFARALASELGYLRVGAVGEAPALVEANPRVRTHVDAQVEVSGAAMAGDALERELRSLWTELIGAPVGLDQSLFELGADSLVALTLLSRAGERFGRRLSITELFEAPTVSGMARLLRRGLESEQAPRPARPARLPLTPGQSRLWFLDRLQGGSAEYNLPNAFDLRGPLDPDALERALRGVQARHEALRTRLVVEEVGPGQQIDPEPALRLRRLDWSGLLAEDQAARWEALVSEARSLVLDLAAEAPFRATLVRLAEREHRLLLLLHHVAFDGWSMGLLLRELSHGYRVARGEALPALPVLPIQLADHALREEARLQSPEVQARRQWWWDLLRDATPLTLPFARPIREEQPFVGAVLARRLPAALSGAVSAVGQRRGCTPFMSFFAAYALLLARCSGSRDPVIGTLVANRGEPDLEPLIGFFVNTLALRLDLSANPSLGEALERARTLVLEALARQDIPFEQVVSGVAGAGDRGRSPLLEILFDWQSAPGGGLELPGLEARSLSLPHVVGRFLLSLTLEERRGALEARWEYDARRLDEDSVRRLADRYEALLSSLAGEHGLPAWSAPWLPAWEQAEIAAFSASEALPPAPPLLSGFWEQAQTRPLAPALDGLGEALCYEELAHLAGRIAGGLVADSAGAGEVIGLLLERGPEQIAALLGLLGEGLVVLPLDPRAPRERLAQMLESAGVRRVITRPALAGALPEGARALDVGALAAGEGRAPRVEVGWERLAVLLFTSGSTGRPKGVALSRGALASFVDAATRRYEIGPRDRVLQLASLSFDAALEEILPVLCAGGTLTLRDEDMLSGADRFWRGAASRGATVLDLPTALWHSLCADLRPGDTRIPEGVRLVILGGERALPEALRRWERALEGRGVRPVLLNTYGPTEATVVCTAHTLDPAVDAEDPPIGRPLPRVRVAVLDEAGLPAPVGVPGELWVGGPGLAEGYFGQPELSAERFRLLPGADGPWRAYRTGDRVLWRADGALLFRGRLDRQIKIRGHRVEPGEVEAALLRAGAREAAVDLLELGGEPRLVAWVVGELAPELLRERLRSALPEAMTPTAWVSLPALPLNAHGKVDLGALPAPTLAPAAARTPPRDALERGLARIWAELLHAPEIGREDDFFALGGHSLLAFSLVDRVERELGLSLPLSAVFRASTLALQAELLRGLRAGAEGLVPLGEGEGPPLFLVHPGGATLLAYSELVSAMGPGQRVIGLEARGFQAGERPDERVEALAERYLPLLRAAWPEGPVLLAGWCFGGLVAYELARRLREEGRELALVAMIDTYLRGGQPLTPQSQVIAALLPDLFGVQVSREALDALEPEAGVELAWTLARERGALPAELDLHRFRRLVAVALAHEHAAVRYHPRPYPGALTLIRARDDAEGWLTDGLGWERLAGSVDVRFLPGRHLTLFHAPFVGALGALVRGLCGEATLSEEAGAREERPSSARVSVALVPP